MKIVILDGHTTNPGDLSWEPLKEFGELEVYEYIEEEKLIDRAKDAEILITGDGEIDGAFLAACPKIKMVQELATGYNNIDVSACRERSVAVYNIPKYSTEGVVQQTISLLLQLTNHINENSQLSRDGQWFIKEGFRYSWAPLTLLNGKSMGIVGLGTIGKRVAEVASALGMSVHSYREDKEACMKSDVISLHCPLTEKNRHMVDESFISNMKDGALLINTARGGLIDEQAVADAVLSGKLSGFASDVLEEEPPKDSPLIGLRNVYITPHASWLTREIRGRMVDYAVRNVRDFLDGKETEARVI